jgi:hypothetical protein
VLPHHVLKELRVRFQMTEAFSWHGQPDMTSKLFIVGNNYRPMILITLSSRYAGNSLLGMIVKSSDKPQDFMMITGISDSSTYDDHRTTWNSPVTYADKCYVADAKNPAADTAAQVSATLSMISLYLKATQQADAATLAKFNVGAVRAYQYAKLVNGMYGDEAATCSGSTALRNCVGDCNATAITVRHATLAWGSACLRQTAPMQCFLRVTGVMCPLCVVTIAPRLQRAVSQFSFIRLIPLCD